MLNYNNDYDYTENYLIGPKKKNPNGISYNADTYYTSNWKTSTLNMNNFENDYIGVSLFFGKNYPNAENKNGTKVILTGKRIKHEYSSNSGFLYKKETVQKKKEKAKNLKSTINDAFE
jgi:hypothetical protein